MLVRFDTEGDSAIVWRSLSSGNLVFSDSHLQSPLCIRRMMVSYLSAKMDDRADLAFNAHYRSAMANRTALYLSLRARQILPALPLLCLLVFATFGVLSLPDFSAAEAVVIFLGL